MFFRAFFFNKICHKCLELFSVGFSIFKVEPKKRPFLTISPHDSLCKMANFPTFQNRVIFHIFDVLLAVSFMEHLFSVSRVIFRMIFS